MANLILVKKSSTSGAVPTTAQLALGELSLNTFDGKLYAKVDNGTPSILELTNFDASRLATGILPTARLPALTGDVTSSDGSNSLTLAAAGTAGTYTKVTTDAKGRVISGTNIAGSDLPVFVGSNGVSGGQAGAVPAPVSTDNTNYLKGDGTWASLSYLAPLASPAFTGTVTLPNTNIGASSLLSFGSAFGDKIYLYSTTYVLGTQSIGSMFLRTAASGNFYLYAGGVYHATAGNPGLGGTVLLTLSSSQFRYQSNDIYHTGNFDPTLKANLASPALTGTPTAPTATGGTNTTQLATTAFVTAAIAAIPAPNDASALTTGTLAAGRLPALSGDVSSSTGSSVVTLSSAGTAGTYTKVTTDIKGRVISGTALVNTDIPAFTGANGSLPGTTGGVPTPIGSDNIKFLRGDSVWSDINSRITNSLTLLSEANNPTDTRTSSITSGEGWELVYQRSRGTLASKTTVANGDIILDRRYDAMDATGTPAWSSTIYERYSVDGTPVAGFVPIKYQYLQKTDVNVQVTPLEIDGLANVSVGVASLATNATAGFIYIPSTTGAPSGTPTAKTGRVPLVYNTADDQLHVYDGSWISMRTTSASSLISGTLPEARLSGAVRERNRILNPAMMVSQERAVGTTIDVTNSSPYIVDGFKILMNNAGTLRCSQQASITPSGSPNRIRLVVQATDTSIGASEYALINIPIEGLAMADLQFGTANAVSFVVGFYIKLPAGTYAIRFANNDGTRSYIHMITISGGQVNTDTFISLTVPGDTSGTWLKGSGEVGMNFIIALSCGSTYQSATTDSWIAGNYVATSAQSNFMGTASATCELSDVRLYKATMPVTWFEVPDPQLTVAQCQRFFRITQLLQSCVTSNGIGVSAAGHHMPMAKTPAVTIISDSSAGSIGTRTVAPLSNYGAYAFATGNAAGGATISVVVTIDARL